MSPTEILAWVLVAILAVTLVGALAALAEMVRQLDELHREHEATQASAQSLRRGLRIVAAGSPFARDVAREHLTRAGEEL